MRMLRVARRLMSNFPENLVYGGVKPHSPSHRATLTHFRQKQRRGDPITVVTAYDYPSAVHIDAAGIDVCLVGGSAGMVVHGHDTTLPISLNKMLLHCRAVARGASHPLLVGLTPEAISVLGGFRRQGKTVTSAVKVVETAIAFQDAGCFSVVLECVPAPVTAATTSVLQIQTIRIGTGLFCSGQAWPSPLPAYNYPSAVHIDAAGIDVYLVSDSATMVNHGHDTTFPISLDEMLVDCSAVAVAHSTSRPLLFCELPFVSYESSSSQTVDTTVRMLKEGGMDSIKLEGGAPSRITAVLTPQVISVLGGFRPQGKTVTSAFKVLEATIALQEAGCFSVLLECVPMLVATATTSVLQIPTIGIGAGPFYSGQVWPSPLPKQFFQIPTIGIGAGPFCSGQIFYSLTKEEKNLLLKFEEHIKYSPDVYFGMLQSLAPNVSSADFRKHYKRMLKQRIDVYLGNGHHMMKMLWEIKNKDYFYYGTLEFSDRTAMKLGNMERKKIANKVDGARMTRDCRNAEIHLGIIWMKEM